MYVTYRLLDTKRISRSELNLMITLFKSFIEND